VWKRKQKTNQKFCFLIFYFNSAATHHNFINKTFPCGAKENNKKMSREFNLKGFHCTAEITNWNDEDLKEKAESAMHRIHISEDAGTTMCSALDELYEAFDKKYNVMIFKRQGNNDHERSFYGVAFSGTLSIRGGFHSATYNVWIFNRGTFRNKADGGWINWGFKGNFNRNDKFVEFY
jgi:hypothetical protein